MATLSPRAADALRATLPDLANDIIAAIAAEVPDYSGAMKGRFAQGVRFGVEVALSRFVDVLAGEPPDQGPRQTYVRLGAGEYRAGRSLDALLAAYRVGARLAWRRFVEAGTKAGFAPDQLYDLGEAIFAYIDEISAESAAGFAEAQSEAAGESQRRRRDLVRVLVQEPPAAEESVRVAAQAAGWTLPRRVAAVVAGEAEAPEREDEIDAAAVRLARRIGPGAVGAAVAGAGRRPAARPRGAGPPQDARDRLGRAPRGARARRRVAGGGDQPPPSGSGVPAVRSGSPLPERPVSGRRRRSPPGAAARPPSRRWRPTSRARAWPRSTPSGPARGNGSRPRCAPGWTVPGRCRRSPPSSTSTRRPSATASSSCASCSATRLEDPEARFELALALRAADGIRYT